MALSSYFTIPVLRPTAEELEDFSSYIEKHIPMFSEAGLLKIVPPVNWAANLPTEKDAESFPVTRPIRQEVKGRQGLWETTNLEQKTMLVPDFRKLAEKQDIEAVDKSFEERERIFWKNMGRFPAIYGADNQGSLFEKTGCSWHFGKINSVLSFLDRDLPGINKAYLYFGMWKALFAWHSEDLELFSVNYVHFGAPKEWYCLRPKDRARFESVAKSLFPGHARACPQFLRHKLSVISPSILRSYGFEVGHVVQEAGQFIVTFPAAFHMGFNHGWNCAESVNFALPCWFEFGKRARVCRCHPDSVRFDVLTLERRWLEATGGAPKQDADENVVWSFTCRCREDWQGTDKDPERPVGHLFQCVCKAWSHVDCYPRYADKDPVALPLQMYCHKCRPVKTKRSAAAAEKAAPATPAAAAAVAVAPSTENAIDPETAAKKIKPKPPEDVAPAAAVAAAAASTPASASASVSSLPSTITPPPPVLPLAISDAVLYAPEPVIPSPLVDVHPSPVLLPPTPAPTFIAAVPLMQPTVVPSPLLAPFSCALPSALLLPTTLAITASISSPTVPPPEAMQVAPELLSPDRSRWPVDTSQSTMFSTSPPTM